MDKEKIVGRFKEIGCYLIKLDTLVLLMTLVWLVAGFILMYIFQQKILEVMAVIFPPFLMLFIWLLNKHYNEESNKNQIRREYLLRNSEIYSPIIDELKDLIDKLDHWDKDLSIASLEKIYKKSPWYLIDGHFRERLVSLTKNLNGYNRQRFDCQRAVRDRFSKKLEDISRNHMVDGGHTAIEFEEVFLQFLKWDRVDLKRVLSRNLDDGYVNINFIGYNSSIKKTDLISIGDNVYLWYIESNLNKTLLSIRGDLKKEIQALRDSMGQALKEPWEYS